MSDQAPEFDETKHRQVLEMKRATQIVNDQCREIAARFEKNPKLINATLKDFYTHPVVRETFYNQLAAMMAVAHQGIDDEANTKNIDAIMGAIEGCRSVMHFAMFSQMSYEQMKKQEGESTSTEI